MQKCSEQRFERQHPFFGAMNTTDPNPALQTPVLASVADDTETAELISIPKTSIRIFERQKALSQTPFAPRTDTDGDLSVSGLNSQNAEELPSVVDPDILALIYEDMFDVCL